jgi:hypothetical protein
MRSQLRMVLLVLTLTAVASPLHAQVLPWNISVDSWFGVDFLVARQDILSRPAIGGTSREYSSEWNPRAPALSGMVEVSPFPFASARLAGSICVGSNNVPVVRDTGVIPGHFEWDMRTDFSAWEAAGLFHVWNSGGYRFSVTAGYRREVWLYQGDPAGRQSADSSLREEFRSDIPFVGLQTAMNFPLWKARFEVLGSWFMTKTIEQKISLDNAAETANGKGDTGGVILFQMDGATHVRPNVTLGLYARYSYQEFIGRALLTSTISGAAERPYKFWYNENVAAFGVYAGVVF